MIRNYVPFVRIQNPSDKRRGPHRKEPAPVARKPNLKVPQPEPKDYMEKKEGEAERMEEQPVESEYTRARK